MNVNISEFVSLSPFSIAVVVVSDNYIETFPHPEKLLVYLQRKCLQLDVEVVSTARPFTIKGSWATIIKIDTLLRTLISRFLVNGFVPTEADFNAIFTHLKEDNSYWDNTVNAKQRNIIPENEVDKNPNLSRLALGLHSQRQPEQDLCLKPTSSKALGLSNLESDDSAPSTLSAKGLFIDKKTLDKWNLSGKSVNKIQRRYLSPWKPPPEPYVIVEAGGTNKTNQPSIIEIEEVLCKVYNKESTDKYQKKVASNGSEKNDSSQYHRKDTNNSVKTEITATENSKESCDGDSFNSNLLISTTPSNNQTVSQTTNSVKKVLKKKRKNLSLQLQADNVQSETCTESEIPEMFNQSQDNEKQSSKRKKKKKSNLLSEITASDNEVINTEETKDSKGKKHKTIKKLKRTAKSSSKNLISERSLSNISESSSPTEQGGSNKSLLVTTLANIKNQDNPRLIKQEGANLMEEILSMQMSDKMVKQNATSDSVYKCGFCCFETTTRRKLTGHQRRIHLTKKFTCEICSKDFGYTKDLRRHMQCHSKPENCCDVCGKMYKDVRKLEEHKRIHTADYVKPEFACKFCSKSFSTKYVLAYHIRSNHLGVKRTYICPTCGKIFSQKSSYLQHANVHLGIRPYVCEECGKTFAYGKSLKEHMLMHTNEKLHPCEICNKCFRQSSGLKVHMKIHSSTKDFVCAVCGKGFSQRQALVRHERIHFGEKPFECLLCKRSFADSSVLRRHLILTHKKDPKRWKEHTLCHTQKRNDYFISVLEDSSGTAKTSELSNPVSQQTVNEIPYGLTEVQHSSLSELAERGQQLYVSDQGNQLNDLQRGVEHYGTVSKHGDTDNCVKVEPVYSNIHESRALRVHFDSLPEHPNIHRQVLHPVNPMPTNNHISQLHPSPMFSHPSNTFFPMEFFPETE